MREVGEIFKSRPRVCHKGDFGTVVLFGGSIKYSGAVKLANMASAAMRGGCGVVRLAVPASLAPAVAPYLLESTLFPYKMEDGAPCEEQIGEALRGVRAIGCGMGWEANAATRQTLYAVFSHACCPLLVDAGGLRIISEEPRILDDFGYPCILTPHPGEFAAMTGKTVSEILAEPQMMAEAFARANGCIVVLKGHTTIVTDGVETYEVDRGGAGMATAGSGDVLAGVLTGMLGYLEPTPRNIAAGVFLTGLAGEIAEAGGTDVTMVASDTIAALPEAVKQVRNR